MSISIKTSWQNLQNKLHNLTNWKYFNEFYAAIFMFIALFSWRFNSLVGMSIVLVLAAIILILLDDFNYILPPSIYFIFMISEGFSSEQIPIPIIVVASIFVLIALFFVIKNIKQNGFKFKKMSSFYGLLGLAIMNLIPIIWCNTIEAGNEVFYFFYIADLGYLIIYLLFINGMKKLDLKLIAVSFTYLALLITFECTYKVIELKDTVSSIFDLWYYMGWGLCNEAGIMICFSVPFIFYLMSQSTTLKDLIFQSLKIAISVVGVLFTTSRGSYLCLAVEVIVLAIALIFTAKLRKQYIIYISSILVVLIALFFIMHDYTFPLVNKVIDSVFTMGLDDNGRVELWLMAFNEFKQSPLDIILGPGICCVIDFRTTAAGFQLTPIVFHSTIAQTIAMGGIFGMLMLLLHLFEKYRNVIKIGLPFILSIGLGYLIVDLYGLIDNTYHMFYYMIPLVITLAAIDNTIYYKEIENDSIR